MKNIVSFLVLDFKKEKETRLCLESIRRHAKIPHQIIYLDNGSNDDYPFQIYKDDLCDILISKKYGGGGGVGQTDLFRACDTEYAYFVQSDQILIHDITLDTQTQFISYLQNGFRCIDLNGDQSNRGVWTDRAHFINVQFFNYLAPFPNGGPGPLHELRWNENYLQEVFSRPENKIAHIKPLFFADNGKTTLRETPNGAIVLMETDTKAVSWIKKPNSKYIFPELTDKEWENSINGDWVDGTVPETYKPHSFKHWK